MPRTMGAWYLLAVLLLFDCSPCRVALDGKAKADTPLAHIAPGQGKKPPTKKFLTRSKHDKLRTLKFGTFAPAVFARK